LASSKRCPHRLELYNIRTMAAEPLTEPVATYLWFAIGLMAWSLYLFGKITSDMFFGENRKSLRDLLKNPVLVAWYLLLPPNMLMMFVYFIEHVRMLALGQQSEAGGLCTFVAFWAINAVVAMNGSSVVIAFVTFKLVKDGKKPELKVILIGNAISWLVGLLIAIIFMTGNSIGPYQGLYCCVKEEQYTGFRVALIFTTFFLSTGSQTFFYYMSYKKIKVTEGGGLQSTGGTVKKASKVIFKRGAEMVAIFYLCWSLMVINSFIAFAGSKPNIWVSAMAAWMTKLMPVLHCYMMKRNLKRIKKIAVTSTMSSQNGEDDEFDMEKRVEEAAANTESLLASLNTVQQAQQKSTGAIGQIQTSITDGFASINKRLEELETRAPAPVGGGGLEAAHSAVVPVSDSEELERARAEQERLMAELQVLRRQLADREGEARRGQDLRSKLVMLQEENLRLMEDLRRSRVVGTPAKADEVR